MTQADESVRETAMQWLSPGAWPRIGEMLIDEGLIEPDDLRAALQLQRRTGLRVAETIVTLGFASSFDVARVLARRLEVDFVDLHDLDVDPLVAQAVPEDLARRYRALAIERTDAGVVVAMCDPRDVFAIDDLRMILGCPVLPVLADPAQIDTAIDRAWSSPTRTPPVHPEPASPADAAVPAPSAVAGGREIEAPVDHLVHAVLAQAIEQRATDVHFEPAPSGVRVRFRVDGTLRDVEGAPLAGHSSAMSLIKILAGVDSSSTGRAHHGTFSVVHGDRTVEVALATLPTADGEVAVLHIGDEPPRRRELNALGLGVEQRAVLEGALRLPQGLVVAGGPTGSGKHTTIYAALQELHRPDRSVVALDPTGGVGGSPDGMPDRVPDGVKRIRVDPRAGMSPSTALASILRVDADVILVDTLDDPDTTRAAVHAARLGHLVLSTVAAPRAAAIPLRLVDLGVAPFLVTSALTCAVAQRLVRKLCTQCSEPHAPDAAERAHLGLPDELVAEGTIRRAVGCDHCAGTGYRGRIAVLEVMPMTETIARLLTTGATSHDIERWAIADGMDTLRTSALRRVADGVLSLDEMQRL